MILAFFGGELPPKTNGWVEVCDKLHQASTAHASAKEDILRIYMLKYHGIFASIETVAIFALQHNVRWESVNGGNTEYLVVDDVPVFVIYSQWQIKPDSMFKSAPPGEGMSFVINTKFLI